MGKRWPWPCANCRRPCYEHSQLTTYKLEDLENDDIEPKWKCLFGPTQWRGMTAFEFVVAMHTEQANQSKPGESAFLKMYLERLGAAFQELELDIKYSANRERRNKRSLHTLAEKAIWS